jgi:hypothetical protein
MRSRNFARCIPFSSRSAIWSLASEDGQPDGHAAAAVMIVSDDRQPRDRAGRSGTLTCFGDAECRRMTCRNEQAEFSRQRSARRLNRFNKYAL